MEGHGHFQYRTSSALACPIIHDGQSLITYSISYTVGVNLEEYEWFVRTL